MGHSQNKWVDENKGNGAFLEKPPSRICLRPIFRRWWTPIKGNACNEKQIIDIPV